MRAAALAAPSRPCSLAPLRSQPRPHIRAPARFFRAARGSARPIELDGWPRPLYGTMIDADGVKTRCLIADGTPVSLKGERAGGFDR